jgi:Zn-dependent membrane protease YugP
MPLKLRSAIVPAVNIGSNLGWLMIFAGMFLQITELAWIGVIALAGGAVFAFVTLPVEFNASARAMRLLSESGLLTDQDEQRGAKSVLDAAALTYVAGLGAALSQLLYYVLLVSGMGRRRD